MLEQPGDNMTKDVLHTEHAEALSILFSLPDFCMLYEKLLDLYGDELSMQAIFDCMAEKVEETAAQGDLATVKDYLVTVDFLLDSKFNLYEEIMYCFIENISSVKQDYFIDLLPPLLADACREEGYI